MVEEKDGSSLHSDGGCLLKSHNGTRGQGLVEAPALRLCCHGNTGVWAWPPSQTSRVTSRVLFGSKFLCQARPLTLESFMFGDMFYYRGCLALV